MRKTVTNQNYFYAVEFRSLHPIEPHIKTPTFKCSIANYLHKHKIWPVILKENLTSVSKVALATKANISKTII